MASTDARTLLSAPKRIAKRMRRLSLRRLSLPATPPPLLNGNFGALVHLDLAHNALASVAGLPAAVPSLTHLDVSHNALCGEACRVLASLSRLTTLVVEGNPFVGSRGETVRALGVDAASDALQHAPRGSHARKRLQRQAYLPDRTPRARGWPVLSVLDGRAVTVGDMIAAAEVREGAPQGQDAPKQRQVLEVVQPPPVRAPATRRLARHEAVIQAALAADKERASRTALRRFLHTGSWESEVATHGPAPPRPRRRSAPQAAASRRSAPLAPPTTPSLLTEKCATELAAAKALTQRAGTIMQRFRPHQSPLAETGTDPFPADTATVTDVHEAVWAVCGEGGTPVLASVSDHAKIVRHVMVDLVHQRREATAAAVEVAARVVETPVDRVAEFEAAMQRRQLTDEAHAMRGVSSSAQLVASAPSSRKAGGERAGRLDAHRARLQCIKDGRLPPGDRTGAPTGMAPPASQLSSTASRAGKGGDDGRDKWGDRGLGVESRWWLRMPTVESVRQGATAPTTAAEHHDLALICRDIHRHRKTRLADMRAAHDAVFDQLRHRLHNPTTETEFALRAADAIVKRAQETQGFAALE